MLRKILFFILIAFMISGCSYKETVKKTDKLQGIYMHNGGYYILGDK
ncbi:lipoprotein, partial [Campylobacter concisus]